MILTQPRLNESLEEPNRVFIGLSLDPGIINPYVVRFSAGQSQANLDNWHLFETENPHTFTRTYQFRVQKRRQETLRNL